MQTNYADNRELTKEENDLIKGMQDALTIIIRAETSQTLVLDLKCGKKSSIQITMKKKIKGMKG